MLSLLPEMSLQMAATAIRFEDLGLTDGIDLGFFKLRFYSLAYLFGILLGYWHLSKMIKAPGSPMAQRHADDLFFYCTLGIILGGRLGYGLFYKPELFLSTDIFKLWEGGMSFHGGLIGVLLAIAWVSRSGNLSFLRVCDYIAVNVPLAYMLGRLANFSNGELWGRQTDVPWAIIFPMGGEVPRHPSQLYQAGFEGLLLGVILIALFWKTSARYRTGLLVGLFTIGIGVGRFVNEFFREPDAHLAQFAQDTGLSMGQWLTIPMILVGIGVMAYALRKPPLSSGGAKAPA